MKAEEFIQKYGPGTTVPFKDKESLELATDIGVAGKLLANLLADQGRLRKENERLKEEYLRLAKNVGEYDIMFLTQDEHDAIIEEAKELVGKDLPEPALLRELYGRQIVIKEKEDSNDNT